MMMMTATAFVIKEMIGKGISGVRKRSVCHRIGCVCADELMG